jgi:RNA polymerase sigma-70 factor (ECF subfamily)
MEKGEVTRLIRRVRRGQVDAFRQLVDAYKERLFAYIWRMVRDHHEAEDICQQVFVKAFESLSSYDDQYAFSTWLYTIAYRTTLNALRKRRALSGDVDFSHIGGAADDAADALASSEEARHVKELIWRAVDELSPPQKTSVLLFYREGQSCQEIGEVLGMPPVTVKSHLHRARAKLREKLRSALLDEADALSVLGEIRLA